MTTLRNLLAVVALIVLWVTVAQAQYVGPKLTGTATLRSGESISGVLLSAQLGIVDGAEIGSNLTDGGYIAILTAGEERTVKATEISSLDIEWTNTGTAGAPKWKIARLTAVTTDGATVTGQPTWLVHATSLNIEQADGTRKKVYAFPLAGANFSANNLLTKLVLGARAPVTDVRPITLPPTTDTRPTTEVVVIEPVTPTADTPVVTVVPDAPVVVPPAPDDASVQAGGGANTPTVTIAAPPLISDVPSGAVIIFEVTNPETGNPMKIKFLLVPLAVE